LASNSGSGWNSSRQFGHTRRTRRCAQVSKHGRRNEERFDAHVVQTRNGTRGVIRVQRGEHLVAGERGLDRDVGSFVVTNFTRSSRCPDPDAGSSAVHPRSSGRYPLHSHLIDTRELVFDGVLDVTMLYSGLFSSLSTEYSVVVLPEPVGR